MADDAFDTLTRRAADATSRRASLAALGGAALTAAVAGPSPVSAKSSKCRKARKKAKKKCKKQVGECEGAVEFFCSDLGPGAQECLALLEPCCNSLKGCGARTATACLIDGAFSLFAPD